MWLVMMAAVYIRFVNKENSSIHKKNSVQIVMNLVKHVLQMGQSVRNAQMDSHSEIRFVFNVEIERQLMVMFVLIAAQDA